ncbi:hypothetical protein TrVE_jg1363 [Triparma verrucosa]|uniref:Uncharacterized protein n=1 Tax=Triparma verrucosa TaxID=1606542 RepID=A0A9W6ZF73_9STRA|nr:hypothetical protein TrVE_jg1363 [Triparma verrucosa]
MSTSSQLPVGLSPPERMPKIARVQPYLIGYGACISIISPSISCYQLCKLYNRKIPPSQLFRTSLMIFPHQTLLKVAQMNMSTPVKEYLNPWAAFAAVGVLQGVVYGQANVHFTRAFKFVSPVPTLTIAAVFRGSGFAGFRDMISQGAPFVLSGSVRESVFEPVLGKDSEVAKWSAVISTSVAATVASQGMHNAQITMQADQSLNYSETVKNLWKKNGVATLWKGAEARVGLLLIVNLLNELLLKPAWEGD